MTPPCRFRESASWRPAALALSFIGAVGAWLSLRAGGNTRDRLLAALGPAWLNGAIMTLGVPLSMIIERHFSLSIKLTAYIVYMIASCLVPAVLLALGALPWLGHNATLALLTAAAVGIWARQQMATESRDQPATADDLRILRRADALLGDASVWNRLDDRVCDDDEASGKRSLFCALQKAAREILGEYQHRNVALHEVRFVIQDATRDRQTEMVIRALRRFSLPHRLMDFNNLPETRFEDVKQVLRVASERIAARLESRQ